MKREMEHDSNLGVSGFLAVVLMALIVAVAIFGFIAPASAATDVQPGEAKLQAHPADKLQAYKCATQPVPTNVAPGTNQPLELTPVILCFITEGNGNTCRKVQ